MLCLLVCELFPFENDRIDSENLWLLSELMKSLFLLWWDVLLEFDRLLIEPFDLADSYLRILDV